MNKVYRQNELREFCKNRKLALLVVLENKFKERNAPKIIRKIVPHWNWVANYNTDPRGRIWVVWNPEIVDYRVEVTHKQFIHGHMIMFQTSIVISIIGVYGLHTIGD